MKVILAFPVLGFLTIVQSAVVSRLPLLYGVADIVLLAVIAWALRERVNTAWHWAIIGGFFVSYVSALPAGVMVMGYLLVTAIARVLLRQIWQTPILAMLGLTFLGTVVIHLLSILALQFQGAQLPFLQSLQLITLPSALLNLLLAVPIYGLINDLSLRVYPEEIEV